MNTAFFSNLKYNSSEFANFFVVSSFSEEYYVCSYKDRDTGKRKIFEILNKFDGYKNLSPEAYDFHHIVEEQHLSDLSFLSHMGFKYEDMPTVLIDKNEHKRYNSILHIRETRLLYLRDQPSFFKSASSSQDRKQAAQKVYKKNGYFELRERIKILKEIYATVYQGNNVLSTIASNILNEHMKLLNDLNPDMRR